LPSHVKFIPETQLPKKKDVKGIRNGFEENDDEKDLASYPM